MGAEEKEVLLVIADISGYTRFVAANRDTLTHAQIVITELMKALLRQARLPLKVSKLEGDAVFFYLEKRGNEALLHRMGDNLVARMDRLFAAFHTKMTELVQSNTCPCASCQGMEMLKLKIVVHSGSALFYRIERFAELSGVDVILVHRLLKNSVNLAEYVLMTEAARKELAIPEGRMLEEGEEQYEELGTIRTFLYQPCASPAGHYTSWFYRWKTRMIKEWSERWMRRGWLRPRPFRNLPAVEGE